VGGYTFEISYVFNKRTWLLIILVEGIIIFSKTFGQIQQIWKIWSMGKFRANLWCLANILVMTYCLLERLYLISESKAKNFPFYVWVWIAWLTADVRTYTITLLFTKYKFWCRIRMCFIPVWILTLLLTIIEAPRLLRNESWLSRQEILYIGWFFCVRCNVRYNSLSCSILKIKVSITIWGS
jgi:hypothetical protein